MGFVNIEAFILGQCLAGNQRKGANIQECDPSLWRDCDGLKVQAMFPRV